METDTAVNIAFMFALPLFIIGIVTCGFGYNLSEAEGARDKVIDLLSYKDSATKISRLANRINKTQDETLEIVLNVIKEGHIRGKIDHSSEEGLVYIPVKEPWEMHVPDDDFDLHEPIPYLDLGGRFNLGEPEMETPDEPDVDSIVESLSSADAFPEPNFNGSIEDILVEVEDVYRAREAEKLLTDYPGGKLHSGEKKKRMLFRPRVPWNVGISGAVADVKSKPVKRAVEPAKAKESKPRAEIRPFSRKKRKRPASEPALQIQVCPLCGRPLVFSESKGTHVCKWCN